MVDDVRSIDEAQVPTDLNLMGVLKKAMKGEEVLWGNLEFNSEGMSLSRMMDIISKWKPRESKKSSAVAFRQPEEGAREETELGPRQRQGQDRPRSGRDPCVPRLQESWSLG